MKLKIEMIYDKKTNQTQTFVWEGMKLIEHKFIDGQLHDTPENRQLIVKNYEANKGDSNDSKRT